MDRPLGIRSLVFTSDYLRDAEGRQGWLLAAGGLSGSLVIWDVKNARPRTVLGDP